MAEKRTPRHAEAGQIFAESLNGEKTLLGVSPRDPHRAKIPNITRKSERLKILEYTGVLLARGSMRIDKGGYVVKRNVPYSSDLNGKYTRLHEELFGRAPTVTEKKGREGKLVTVFSKLNHEYLTQIIGLDPDASTKERLLSSSVRDHLLKKENSDSRRAFLKGFFNARIGPTQRDESRLPFKFQIYHSNHKILELLTDVCAAEGIKLTGAGRMRRISENDSILKTVKLIDEPYTLARIASLVTEKKSIGRERSEPKALAKMVATSDKQQIADLLGQIKLPQKSPSRSYAFVQGKKILFEDQVSMLRSFIQTERKYNLNRQLELLNSRPGLVDELIHYTRTNHPKYRKVIEVLQKSKNL